MKFVQRDLGEAAEVNSGGGDRGLGKEIVTLFVLVTIAMVVIYFGVFAITEVVVSRISPEREQELFSSASRSEMVVEVPDALKDKFELCEQVLEKLQAYEEVPGIRYTLTFENEIAPNAYAMPGGTISVTRGLLNSLDEEIAIAFVLAHELGHFAQRDHLRGIGRHLGFALCVQILFGGDADVFTDSATSLVLASYSRQQESGADDFALRCVLAIYGETTGAEALFEVLEAEDGAQPAWAYMFSTHPDNQSRIRRILESSRGE